MRGQNKEIKMAATNLGYNNLPNRDSSSSSPTVGQTSTSDQPQNSHHHHHHLYTPPPLALPQNQQPQRPTSTTDPDPSSSPVANTTTSTTPITPTTVTATAPQQTKIWYRECMKNHAASMGSHVVDGCGEFMPSGEEGTPESLKCAACECHRNFHRKEVEGEQQPQPSQHSQHQHQHVPNYQSYYPNNNNNNNKHNNGHLQFPTPPPPPSLSLPHQHHRFSHVLPTHTAGPVPPLMMAFGGPAAESSSEDLNMFQCNAGAQVSVQAQPVSKKRFRTKFSQQQKDRMMEFAEKLGWKIQKHDEQEVQQFCSQIGIKRQVFKVWMHNNKQAMKKQQM